MQHEYVDSEISSYHLVLTCTKIVDNVSMGCNPKSLPEPVTQWKLTSLVSGFFNNLIIGFGIPISTMKCSFWHILNWYDYYSFGTDHFLLSFFSAP